MHPTLRMESRLAIHAGGSRGLQRLVAGDCLQHLRLRRLALVDRVGHDIDAALDLDVEDGADATHAQELVALQRRQLLGRRREGPPTTAAHCCRCCPQPAAARRN